MIELRPIIRNGTHIKLLFFLQANNFDQVVASQETAHLDNFQIWWSQAGLAGG